MCLKILLALQKSAFCFSRFLGAPCYENVGRGLIGHSVLGNLQKPPLTDKTRFKWERWIGGYFQLSVNVSRFLKVLVLTINPFEQFPTYFHYNVTTFIFDIVFEIAFSHGPESALKYICMGYLLFSNLVSL